VVVLFALFTVISTFVVKKITDPLKKLTNAATKLGDGNYDMEIDKSSASEIKLLSAAFENMAVRLREREQSLRLSANRDSMTGLRNTTSYVAWIAEFDKKISNGGVDFGVAMLDLNDLKKTNDEYGHEMGDKLIVSSAKIISDVFKKSPVFRIGGDEFLVVLQNEDLKNCEELFSLLQLKCLSTFIADKHKPISIAVGFSRFDPDKDLRFIDVFKRADYQMYENKKQMKSKS
jgi:diguanylate cyclase (GGDEF)-like protein